MSSFGKKNLQPIYRYQHSLSFTTFTVHVKILQLINKKRRKSYSLKHSYRSSDLSLFSKILCLEQVINKDNFMSFRSNAVFWKSH